MSFNSGDKVKSNLMGCFYGIPGEIVKPATMQTGKIKKYIIELENGIKIILPENLILKDEPPADQSGNG